jgi:hypothetical protein
VNVFLTPYDFSMHVPDGVSCGGPTSKPVAGGVLSSSFTSVRTPTTVVVTRSAPNNTANIIRQGVLNGDVLGCSGVSSKLAEEYGVPTLLRLTCLSASIP